jgi:predicted 3-demethylubiquinone-9 3-methyltransferase (glyoxalase superfamily)
MNGISTFLWFDEQAAQAAAFYVSIFPNSSIDGQATFEDERPGKEFTSTTVSFELDGRPFTALNGGPLFAFTPAISFVVSCEGQDEVDYYWDRLGDGGEPGRCGWLVDRFGVSWQVVPTALSEYLGGPDPEGSSRAMAAMLEMDKLDIAGLRQAYEGA